MKAFCVIGLISAIVIHHRAVVSATLSLIFSLSLPRVRSRYSIAQEKSFESFDDKTTSSNNVE